MKKILLALALISVSQTQPIFNRHYVDEYGNSYKGPGLLGRTLGAATDVAETPLVVADDIVDGRPYYRDGYYRDGRRYDRGYRYDRYGRPYRRGWFN